MNFLKLRHQNMKNYNANPRPYGRGFFLYRNKSNIRFLKGREQGKGKTFLRVFQKMLGSTNIPKSQQTLKKQSIMTNQTG